MDERTLSPFSPAPPLVEDMLREARASGLQRTGHNQLLYGQGPTQQPSQTLPAPGYQRDEALWALAKLLVPTPPQQQRGTSPPRAKKPRTD